MILMSLLHQRDHNEEDGGDGGHLPQAMRGQRMTSQMKTVGMKRVVMTVVEAAEVEVTEVAGVVGVVHA
jgi:hypothetical protein